MIITYLQQKKQIRGLAKIAAERKEQYQERSKELTERADEKLFGNQIESIII